MKLLSVEPQVLVYITLVIIDLGLQAIIMLWPIFMKK